MNDQMVADNQTAEKQEEPISGSEVMAETSPTPSTDILAWLTDDRPMQKQSRDTLPDLKRDTFFPEGYIDLLNPPENLGDGHTGVFSLSSLTGNNDYISQREIDELEGRSFFDRPIVANIITIIMTAAAVALLLWAIFAL